MSLVAGGLLGGLLPVVAEAARFASGGEVGSAAFASVLEWGCAAAAVAVTGWLWLVATLVTLDAARGMPATRRGVPVALRRVLLALCGAALTGGLAAPALAGGTTATDPGSAGMLAGLRLPERVAVSPAPAGQDHAPHRTDGVAPVAGVSVVDAGATPGSTRGATIVVAPGDTLWGLAARRLGPQASVEQTAAAWQALYVLNRELIGPDPDVIVPGQRLVLPPAGPDGGAR